MRSRMALPRGGMASTFYQKRGAVSEATAVDAHGVLEVLGEVFWPDVRPLADDEGVLHCILKLAHVARPGVPAQQVAGGRREGRGRALVLIGVDTEPVPRQFHHVLGPHGQRVQQPGGKPRPLKERISVSKGTNSSPVGGTSPRHVTVP